MDVLNNKFENLELDTNHTLNNVTNNFNLLNITDQQTVDPKCKKNNSYYTKRFKEYVELNKINNVINCIDKGVNIRDDKDSALKIACLNGHTEIVKILIDRNTSGRMDLEFGLLWSIRNGHLDIVKLLLKCGAKKKSVDNICLTDYSSLKKRETLFFLILNGFNVNTNYNFIYHYLNTVGSKYHSKEYLDQIKHKISHKIRNKRKQSFY